MNAPRVLITGANGGIGRATCAALSAAGYHVIGSDLDAPGHADTAVAADISDPADRERLVATVTEFGGLDGLVFAHGVAGTGDVRTISPTHLRRVLDINFVAICELYDALVPHLDTDACVVAVASQAGLRGERSSAAYCASKFAVVGWYRALQPPSNLRLRLISPGATDTRLVHDAFAGIAAATGDSVDELTAQRTMAIPAGRLGWPSEIAAAVVFAMSSPLRRLELTPTGGETLS